MPAAPLAAGVKPLAPPSAAEWRAIVARDRRADGRFVYAVRTTGVYCRPSCGARRPLRRNAAVLASPAEAERAGFRACRRCGPRDAAGPDERAVRRMVRAARAILDARLDAPVPLAALARAVGASPFHLQRTFARLVGASPKRYHDERRLERWKALARSGETVAAAAYAAGFGSSRSLYTRAAARLGMTPAAYRRGGRGAVRFATAAARGFGRVLVAASARGVCAVLLEATDAALEASLRRELPAADLARDDAGLGAELRAVLRALAGEAAAAPTLDLDPPGAAAASAFRRRVFGALAAIPPGETRSYGALAAAIGRPGGARAVGAACAANRVAALVPCHRAVGAGGAATGYRWGIARKRRLLATERRAAEARADSGTIVPESPRGSMRA